MSRKAIGVIVLLVGLVVVIYGFHLCSADNDVQLLVGHVR